MPQFQFEISKYYLLCHALARKEKGKGETPFKQWGNLTERLSKQSEEAYIFITGGPWWTSPGETIFGKSKGFPYFKEVYKSTEKLLKIAIKSKEFGQLYKETKGYLQWVKKQWRRNEKKALQLVQEITGIKLPSRTIKIFITHPKLRNGNNFPEENIIVWGNQEKWKNYSTVYLCHEFLHILVHNKTKNPTLMHAFIELAIDQELRLRLNKRGKYFEVIGHKPLLKLEKYILPFWKEYLKKKGEKNIFEIEKSLLKNKKVRRLIKESDQLWGDSYSSLKI